MEVIVVGVCSHVSLIRCACSCYFRGRGTSLPEDDLQPLPESLFSVYALALPRGHGFGSHRRKMPGPRQTISPVACSGATTQTGALDC